MGNVVVQAENYFTVVDRNKMNDKLLPPNNNAKNRWVDPIRSLEEIRLVDKYLQDKIERCVDPVRRKIYARNQLIFIIGTRTGFRVSDLERFTWGLFFTKSGAFYKNAQKIIEMKTGKQREVILTDSVKKAISLYIEMAKPDIDTEEYLFIGKNKKYELYNIGMDKKIIDDADLEITTTLDQFKKSKHRGLSKIQLEDKKLYLDKMKISYSVRRFHITEAGINDIIKDFAEACNLEGNYACRSLRKTYAYRMYRTGLDQGKTDREAINLVQSFLNHSNADITERYLGLRQIQDFGFMNSVEW